MRQQASTEVIDGALALGFTVSAAVQNALGCSLAEFARRHDVGRAQVTMCLNAQPRRVYPRIRDYLAADLDVPRSYIDALIARARKDRAGGGGDDKRNGRRYGA